MWQSGRDGSSLLRGAGRVLTGVPHYFQADFITEYEDKSRADRAALVAAVALFQTMWSDPMLTAGQWAQKAGWAAPRFAGRGIKSGPQDAQIERQIQRGTLSMPLWGVSLDPDVPETFGSRFRFEIHGPFPGLIAADHSNIKHDEQEVISGGVFRVTGTQTTGSTTRVELAYESPIGDRVGSDPVLLNVLSQVPDVQSSRLGRNGLPGHSNYWEDLALDIAGGHHFELIRHAKQPDLVDGSYLAPSRELPESSNVYLDDDAWMTYKDQQRRGARETLSADRGQITDWIQRRRDASD